MRSRWMLGGLLGMLCLLVVACERQQAPAGHGGAQDEGVTATGGASQEGQRDATVGQQERGGSTVSILYTCREHGAVPVVVEENEAGEPVRFRVGQGEWVDARDDAGPHCPICGERLFVKAKVQSAFDFDVTWRCLACDHAEQDKAAVGPRACPDCGEMEYWPSVTFKCPDHGEFPVYFRYTTDGKIEKIRVADGAWVPQLDEERRQSNVVCPTCGKSLMPAGHAGPGKPGTSGGASPPPA